MEEFITSIRIAVKSRTDFTDSSSRQRQRLAIWITTNVYDGPIKKNDMRRYILSAILGIAVKSQTELDCGTHRALLTIFSSIKPDDYKTYIRKIQTKIESNAGSEPKFLYKWHHPDIEAYMSYLRKRNKKSVPYARGFDNKGGRNGNTKSRQSENQLTLQLRPRPQ